MEVDDFPYRLAASDLDGTLLGPHKEISPANFAAMRRLQDAGTRFILASGRRHQNSIRFQDQLGLKDLLISCAGALVKNPQTGETLHEVLIPPALAEELVARGEQDNYTVIYYHRDGLYVSARTHWTELYESRVGERAELYPGGLRELGGEAALKIVWYGEPATVQKIRSDVEKEYDGRLGVVATDPENLEFMSADADKARALAVAADHYSVAREATVAFGDGENDAPMLRWAGLGVAMDGGNERAKQAAGLVSPTGAHEESFARGVAAVFDQVRRPNFRSNSA